MEDVEKLKEAYRKILAMYKEAGIIKEVRYGYALNSDGSLKFFHLFVIPQNAELLEELFETDDLSVSYAESLEGTLFENILILGKGYFNEVKVMVDGSGNTLFNPTNLKILEV